MYDRLRFQIVIAAVAMIGCSQPAWADGPAGVAAPFRALISLLEHPPVNESDDEHAQENIREIAASDMSADQRMRLARSVEAHLDPLNDAANRYWLDLLKRLQQDDKLVPAIVVRQVWMQTALQTFERTLARDGGKGTIDEELMRRFAWIESSARGINVPTMRSLIVQRAAARSVWYSRVLNRPVELSGRAAHLAAYVLIRRDDPTLLPAVMADVRSDGTAISPTLAAQVVLQLGGDQTIWMIRTLLESTHARARLAGVLAARMSLLDFDPLALDNLAPDALGGLYARLTDAYPSGRYDSAARVAMLEHRIRELSGGDVSAIRKTLARHLAEMGLRPETWTRTEETRVTADRFLLRRIFGLDLLRNPDFDFDGQNRVLAAMIEHREQMALNDADMDSERTNRPGADEPAESVLTRR